MHIFVCFELPKLMKFKMATICVCKLWDLYIKFNYLYLFNSMLDGNRSVDYRWYVDDCSIHISVILKWILQGENDELHQRSGILNFLFQRVTSLFVVSDIAWGVKLIISRRYTPINRSRFMWFKELVGTPNILN